jgi:flagellar assembly protein FliH
MSTFSQTIRFTRPLADVVMTTLTGAEYSNGSSASPQDTDQWKSAYEQGKIDGEKSLGEQLLKQRSELHELMNGLVDSLRNAVPQVIRDTESMVVSIALEIAQKLVGEMPISVPMLEGVVRNALSEVEGNSNMTVRLHPADLDLLKNSNSPLLEVQEEGNDVRFLGSPEVTRGGCLIQTRFGTVDARRETKFDLLKQSMAI